MTAPALLLVLYPFPLSDGVVGLHDKCGVRWGWGFGRGGISLYIENKD